MGVVAHQKMGAIAAPFSISQHPSTTCEQALNDYFEYLVNAPPA